MTLWMAVTADKYELPLAVADTGIELARMLGISSSVISRSLEGSNYRKCIGRNNNRKYIKVQIEEDEE